ncbi:hypothetical protein KFZ76_15105 [Methylovulum psychrotolerans]|uniref:hypothetical protein n=1 Tax=Methylovulum psychrotolerans TaxID=1704499 RepID=UPI001BFF0DE6|nr:hypothetical protein [Methylovulum psychrotolerans]MBT9099027.1 hypothetical protein [Methylovulum psychrotolerans]
MTRVFVSGSIKIKHLDSKVTERLKNIISSDFTIIVGDADGVDSSIQEYLRVSGVRSVVVYCSGDTPRNNLGHWDTKKIATPYRPGTRQYFTAKDKTMAEDCDYGFMIWDASSAGTLSNALELAGKRKAALVYLNKTKQFIKIKNIQDIEKLIEFISKAELKKIDEKIGLFKKIEAIKFNQNDLFGLQAMDAIDTFVALKQPYLPQHP